MLTLRTVEFVRCKYLLAVASRDYHPEQVVSIRALTRDGGHLRDGFLAWRASFYDTDSLSIPFYYVDGPSTDDRGLRSTH